ncbi:MAG: hypothetical protein M3077_11360 [Candidatus Dormibacteraeota bacterium]|nr:hypothetical protein [Candidatus Dormibacteraeota bacterium]
MKLRFLLGAIIGLVILACLVWLFGASIVWSTREILVGPDSPRALEGGRLAIAMYAVTGINLVALVVFVVRQRGWGWWLLTAIQLGDFALSGVEGFVRERTWFILAGLAALTLFALLRFQRIDARAGEATGSVRSPHR